MSCAGCGDDSAAQRVVLTGTLVAAGDMDITGITTDDVVAVLDRQQGALAIPVAGGDPQLVDAAADRVATRGSVVYAFHNYDGVSAFGDLTIWTAGAGAHPFSTGATPLVAVSADGTRILATAGSSSDGTSTNVVVGGVDGTPPTMVARVSRAAGCGARGGFAAGRFLLTHCDLGSTDVTISWVDPATGAMENLLAHARNQFAIVNDSVLVIGTAGNAVLQPPGGAAAVPLGNGVVTGALAPDGSAVLFANGGVLARAPAGGGPISTVIPGGVLGIRGFSPDAQHVTYFTAESALHGYTNLLLGSAVASGPAVTLLKTTDGALFGDPFTVDSSRALYVTGANDALVGTLRSRPVDGGDEVTHAEGVWSQRAYAGTRIVYANQYVPVPDRPGLVELHTVDTAGGLPAAVARPAGATYVLTAARDRVVFTFDDGSDRRGLYVAPLP
jgi:hypothetical protein